MDASTTPSTTLDLGVGGMTCASCVNRVERALKKVPGVSDADVRITWEPPWNQQMISEEGKMTLGFISNDNGEVTGVEERWVRRRKTVPRAASSAILSKT